MGKSLIGIAAVAALAGCSVTAHAAEPPASAGRKTATPAAGQGGAARPSWDDVDFETIMFGELGCPDFDEAQGKADVFSVGKRDLTGDGNAEAVVAGACVTTTGANPAQVIVFAGDAGKAGVTGDAGKAGEGSDGGADITHPRRLIAIGKGQDLITANVSISGRTVTVVSDAISGTAPRCCPDLLITQAYTWKADHFARLRLEKKAQ